MKIEDNRIKNKTKFKELSVGDCFEYNSDILIKISNAPSSGDYNTYNFTGGYADHWIELEQEVLKVNVKMSIVG